MMDFDKILDEATPQSQMVNLCLDGALLARRDELLAEFESQPEKPKLRAGQRPRVLEIADELKELQERISERIVRIRVTAMPPQEWLQLKAKHPLNKDKDKRTELDLRHGFSVEAVARKSLLEYGHRIDTDGEAHEVSAGQWSKLFEKVAGGDIESLLLTVVAVNQLRGQHNAAEFLKFSRTTEGSEPK